MKRYTYFIYVVAMLFMLACNSRKSSGDVFQSDMEIVVDGDCILTRFTIHRQRILRMDTCHLHHQTIVALTGHLLHRLMEKDIPTMSLTTCAALTRHPRMTWMTTV